MGQSDIEETVEKICSINNNDWISSKDIAEGLSVGVSSLAVGLRKVRHWSEKVEFKIGGSHRGFLYRLAK